LIHDNPTTPSLPQRLMALNAYRGFVLFLMMAEFKLSR